MYKNIQNYYELLQKKTTKLIIYWGKLKYKRMLNLLKSGN